MGEVSNGLVLRSWERGYLGCLALGARPSWPLRCGLEGRAPRNEQRKFRQRAKSLARELPFGPTSESVVAPFPRQIPPGQEHRPFALQALGAIRGVMTEQGRRADLHRE